jgi:hypothetical protein
MDATMPLNRVQKTARLVGLLLVALCLAGCGGDVTIKQWQRDFESYVAEQANGDLNAMRGLVAGEGRSVFAVYGKKDPDQSTDVAGLWLGRHQYEGRNYQVFLIGVVEARRVETIRLAAVRRDGNTWHWQMTGPTLGALGSYRAFHRQRVKNITTTRRPGEADLELPDWPAPADDFALDTAGRTVAVTETNSGAQWRLELSGKSATGETQ